MFKKIFIINGSGGCGKDTFVKFVGECVPTMNYSSVQPIKDIAKHLGWKGEKTDKARKMLSDLKKISTDYNNLPMNYIDCAIRQFVSPKNTDMFLFIHIREPEEITNIVKKYKEYHIETILISNPNVKEIKTNDSDKNVSNYKYDYLIPNDGTLNDFKETAECFTKSILAKFALADATL